MSSCRRELARVLAELDHKDLDTIIAQSTVEVVARHIFREYMKVLSEHAASLRTVTRLEIKVNESDVAAASYYEENRDGLFV